MSDGRKWTKNYGMFDLDAENRPHNPGKHKALYESLEKNGYDGAQAIVCVRRNGRLVIVDGQHRYFWCMERGVAFTYTVSQIAEPRGFNTAAVPWSMGDWISSHVAGGNPGVTELNEFMLKHELPATMCEMLLAGRVGTGMGKTIKAGTVEVKDSAFADHVASTIVGLFKTFKHAKDMNCVTAIARFCRVSQFKGSRLVSQCEAWPGEIVRHATVDQYSAMFDEVYNRGAGKKLRIPLKFLADQEMRTRNRSVKK